jgi:hypothetical protein
MPSIPELLTEIEMELQQILLDPNNPRFSELGQHLDAVPEHRFAEPRVQTQAYDRMKSGRFDVAELRDTIKNLGFLPMDRIVVRRWLGQGDMEAPLYVVIEGNRRVTALKWLVELHETGRETFSEEQRQNFTRLKVLLLDHTRAPDRIRWILPGLRHVSGIKEWGPYQKARAVFELRDAGTSPQEAAQSLGLSTRAANQLWRSYLALNQMREDEEYGEHAEPNRYSYFEEVFKRPAVKDWLQWSDDERRFLNLNGTREFYSWMVGEVSDEGEEAGTPKFSEAKSVRDLGTIINDPAAMAVFRAPGGSLTRAMARFEADRPQEWMPAVANAETVLAALSADSIRNMAGDELAAVKSLADRIARLMQDHERLAEVGDGGTVA